MASGTDPTTYRTTNGHEVLLSTEDLPVLSALLASGFACNPIANAEPSWSSWWTTGLASPPCACPSS